MIAFNFWLKMNYRMQLQEGRDIMRNTIEHLSNDLRLLFSMLIAGLLAGCLNGPVEATPTSGALPLLPSVTPTEPPAEPPTATPYPPTATALALVGCPPNSPNDAQWSPDGNRLVITLHTDLVIADLRTGTLTTLVSLPGIMVYGAEWSPDGKKILFMYVEEYLGPAAAYIADVETGTVGLLSSVWGNDYAWSPDSSRIAFGYGGLMITEVGVSTRQVVHGYELVSPAWSPDSSQIAFAYDPQGDEGPRTLAVVNADGSNLRTLTETPVDITFVEWSPDGTHIAFTTFTYVEGAFSIVNVVNVDGTGLTELAVDPLTIEGLAWSADGESVLYYSWEYWSDVRHDLHIYRTGLDGSPPESLLKMQHDPEEIIFSPDRTRIAYVVWEREAYDSLYVAGLDGSGVFPVIDGSHYCE
jgi:Tol biopolymer transport system component